MNALRRTMTYISVAVAAGKDNRQTNRFVGILILLSAVLTLWTRLTASRQGMSPSALMKMRWVVLFKDDGRLKARLVVQGFTDQRLGKVATSLSNRIPSFASVFFSHLPRHLAFKRTRET